MPSKTLFIVFCFLLLSPWYVAAQESSKGHSSGEPFTPSTIIIIIMVIIFLFTGCLAIFLRCFAGGCFGLHIIPINYPDSTHEGQLSTKGLDADVIKSLPTYLYADVKQHRKVGQLVELECAVCLNEFQDPEALRLLPGCSHVFHPRCIDRWLAGHLTCPVCRQSLLETAAESDKQPPHSIINITEVAAAAGQHGSSSDDDNQVEEMRMMMEHDDLDGVKKNMIVGKFSRSHSTGHSIRIMGNAERYTLVLPADYQDPNQERVPKYNVANDRLKKGLLRTCMIGSPRSGYKCGWFPMTPPPPKATNSGPRSVRTLVSSSLFKSSSFKNLTVADRSERQLA